MEMTREEKLRRLTELTFTPLEDDPNDQHSDPSQRYGARWQHEIELYANPWEGPVHRLFLQITEQALEECGGDLDTMLACASIINSARTFPDRARGMILGDQASPPPTA